MKSNHHACGAVVETLEDRRLLAVPAVAVQIPHLPVTASLRVPSVSSSRMALIQATVDQPFSGVVATIKHLHGVAADFSNLQGTIQWGDGNASAATFTRNANGSISVSGDHTWQSAGTFPITVTLSRTPINTTGGPNIFMPIRIGTLHAVAHVQPAIVGTGGVTFSAVAGQQFTQVLGQFNFLSIDLIVSSHIDWGDGTALSVGDLSGGLLAGGNYTVSGTHTYASPGQYTIHVVVNSTLAGNPHPTFMGLVTQFNSTANVT